MENSSHQTIIFGALRPAFAGEAPAKTDEGKYVIVVDCSNPFDYYFSCLLAERSSEQAPLVHRSRDGQFLLAASSGTSEEKWLLARFKEDIDFSGPTYIIFGLSRLVLEAQMLDHCLGSSHLQSPYFKAIPRFMAECLTPDRKHRFNYGDSASKLGSLGYELSAYT